MYMYGTVFIGYFPLHTQLRTSQSSGIGFTTMPMWTLEHSHSNSHSSGMEKFTLPTERSECSVCVYVCAYCYNVLELRVGKNSLIFIRFPCWCLRLTTMVIQWRLDWLTPTMLTDQSQEDVSATCRCIELHTMHVLSCA